MFENKKGQGLSVNAIIIFILAILVLVLIALALTGGFGNFVEWLGRLGGGQEAQGSAVQCNTICTSFQVTGDEDLAEKFCNEVYTFDVDGDGQVDSEATCSELAAVSCNAIIEREFSTGTGCAAF